MKDNKAVKLGLIGCGHWGPNYIRAFQKIKGACLGHACDLDKARLKVIKDKYPYIKTTADSAQILEDGSFDAVIVATPAKTHYSLVKRALKAGKHVLVEKPITVEAAQARELMKLSEKHKKVLMPGHIFEHHDGIKKIRRYISQKTLGKVYYMYSRRTNLGPIRDDVNAIWDLALHDIYIFNFILGAVPVRVSANGFSYLRGHLEDVGFITLHYPRNVIAHLHVSWLDPRKIREIVVVGSKKMLMFNDLDYVHPIKIYDKSVRKKRYQRSYYTFDEFKMLVRDGQALEPKIKIREPLLQECREFIKRVSRGNTDLELAKRGLDSVKTVNDIDKLCLKKR